MKVLKLIARIVLGAVFIFSGFVKGVDPNGFAIKLGEYFESFGIPGLEHITLILGILVCTGEFIIGVCLVLGLKMKITAWAALLFMSFFTLLTFYSALANPVTDCGCFGDAIKLTNWQTFFKNLVFIVFAIFIFRYRKDKLSELSVWKEWVLIGIYTTVGVWVFVYNIHHLPIIDFRPYHIGADIPADKSIPEGAPASVYESTFLYSKNGVIKEFNASNYPWNDSTWVWVETKSKRIKEGYEPPIHDFSIALRNGNDITDSILFVQGYTFLLISTDLREADELGMKKAATLAEEALHHGYGFYCLTASPMDEAAAYQANHHLNYPFCSTDKTTLKTINRANPGLVLLKDGVVLGQWHYNDFPDTSFVKGNMLASQLNTMRKQEDNKMIGLFIIIFILSVTVLAYVRQTSKMN